MITTSSGALAELVGTQECCVVDSKLDGDYERGFRCSLSSTTMIQYQRERYTRHSLGYTQKPEYGILATQVVDINSRLSPLILRLPALHIASPSLCFYFAILVYCPMESCAP